MTNTERLMTYHMAIEHYGKELQLEVVQEELAELIQAISKYKRNKSTKSLNNIVEEVADCYIMLNQLEIMLALPSYEISSQIDYKLNRLQQRFKENK